MQGKAIIIATKRNFATLISVGRIRHQPRYHDSCTRFLETCGETFDDAGQSPKPSRMFAFPSYSTVRKRLADRCCALNSKRRLRAGRRLLIGVLSGRICLCPIISGRTLDSARPSYTPGTSYEDVCGRIEPLLHDGNEEWEQSPRAASCGKSDSKARSTRKHLSICNSFERDLHDKAKVVMPAKARSKRAP